MERFPPTVGDASLTVGLAMYTFGLASPSVRLKYSTVANTISSVKDAIRTIGYVNPIVGDTSLKVRHATPTEKNSCRDRSNTYGDEKELLQNVK